MTDKTLGHYRVGEQLGRGGMGEVYLADDLNLNRKVALKFLPDAFAGDPERMARFEREAKLLASLNHHNIAAIYGLEQAEGKRFLVLELVEGETLAQRLSKGALPLEKALAICRQIAEGLEAAHEKGVIHRDLKPANVMITEGDNVKILDFGLAKALSDESRSIDSSQSPTLTEAMTRPGVILGTAAYMSPEQAKGKSVDKRADIWAFGCILYECLTGKRAFEGETVTETLASVLKEDPNWQTVPVMIPPNIRFVLHRCLQKDPKLRLHDIADALFEIAESIPVPRADAAPMLKLRLRWREIVAWSLSAVAILAVALLSIIYYRQSSSTESGNQSLARLVVRLPETEPLAFARWAPLGIGRPSVAISPDGKQLVWVAVLNGVPTLYQRGIDKFEATPIPGTQGAYDPFFSPDGKWVGFFAENKLKKVTLSGNEPISICAATNPYGGSWGSDDSILFSDREGSTLRRVPSTGGTPQIVSLKKSGTVRWPELLPDAKAAIITVGKMGSYVAVLSLETGEMNTLIKNAAHGRYARSGHLVFVSGNSLLAVPFDSVRLTVTGSAVPILQGVRTEDSGVGQFSFSHNGFLVYAPGFAQGVSELVWVDRQRAESPLDLSAREYGTTMVSPDGRRLAITVKGPSSDILIYDLVRGTQTRLTVDGSNTSPVWSPDGKRVVFSSSKGGVSNIISKAADDSGDAEELFASENSLSPTSYSPDGNLVAFYLSNREGYPGIWILPLKGEHKPWRFLNDRFNEWGAKFSPDGNWMAYTSDESGQYEVYVRPYPSASAKYQISTAGGEEPVWSPNGQELFYRNGQKWMVLPITLRSEFSAGRPRVLFEGSYINTPGPSYDISPDGKRFLMLRPPGDAAPDLQLNVVLGWFEELKRLIDKPSFPQK